MSNRLQQFQNTYSYEELVKKYPLSTEGLWEVRGEDPNCDLGGSHYQPILFTVSGILEDVIEASVDQPNFWTWGSGGSFRLITPMTITDVKAKAMLHQEKEQLQQRIKEVEKRLQKS
jgi:hypothetical protein